MTSGYRVGDERVKREGTRLRMHLAGSEMVPLGKRVFQKASFASCGAGSSPAGSFGGEGPP